MKHLNEISSANDEYELRRIYKELQEKKLKEAEGKAKVGSKGPIFKDKDGNPI